MNDEVNSEWSSGEFRRKLRGCAFFLASILLPTLVPRISLRCRAWRWRARAGNALVELSSLQHTGLLAVSGTVRCSGNQGERKTSPKDAPCKVGYSLVEQNPSLLIQSSVAPKVWGFSPLPLEFENEFTQPPNRQFLDETGLRSTAIEW